MATQNTGNKAYKKLVKVTTDGTDRPLDDNNMLCSDTGLTQSIKDNSIADADYIAPFQDLTNCPLQEVTPIDCVVSEWSDWSECNSGSQTRTRTIVTPSSNGGASCPVLTESKSCAIPIVVLGEISNVVQCGAGDDTKIITSTVTLSSPVTVDTIFTVGVVYSINGSCTTSLGSATTDVTILAGETSGNSPECSGGAPGFPSEITAVICSSTVTGHNNTVDNITI